MKTLPMVILLAFSANAAQFSWNPNPENTIIGYKVWREDNGNYHLLGSTAGTTFNLGNISVPTKVCVSATAFGNIDGAKSEIMVIDPAEPPPYAYVSLHGPRTFTYAMNRSDSKRFFRFDIVGNYATIQDSFSLNGWTSRNTILVGSGYDNPPVTISFR